MAVEGSLSDLRTPANRKSMKTDHEIGGNIMEPKSFNKLDDENLSQAAGGYIFDTAALGGFDPAMRWEVIDENGDVIGTTVTKQGAETLANYNGLSPVELTWPELQKLRASKKR